MIPRTTNAAVVDAIKDAIVSSEPEAEIHEIRRIGSDVEGLNETAKYIVRLDFEPDVVSNALVVGLKTKLNANARNGIQWVGDKPEWTKEGQDFTILLFDVDMMKECTL